MSATLNIDLFIDYFDNCPAITGNDKTQSVNGILQNAHSIQPTFLPEMKNLPIRQFFLGVKLQKFSLH